MANDPFFAAQGGGMKRKRPSKSTSSSKGHPSKSRSNADRNLNGKGKVSAQATARQDSDEVLSSEDDEDGSQPDQGDDVLSDEEENERETAAQKRLRLAKIYLENLQTQHKSQDGFDAADLDKDYLEQRLQNDVLAQSGKFHLFVANDLQPPSAEDDVIRAKKGHRSPLTSTVLHPSGSALYTASKDGSLSQWALTFNSASSEASTSTAKQTAYFPKTVTLSSKAKAKKRKERKQIKTGTEGDVGHTDAILSLDISSDGRLLASAGADKVLGAWKVEGEHCEWVKGLRGHKDIISTVKFRHGTTQVFTSSYDRTVKQFDLAALTYIDTLFGHQDTILDLDCLKSETALTAGGRDKSLRFWKVAEESQLVFRGGGTSRMRQVLEGSRAADDTETNGDLDAEASAKGGGRGKKFIEGSAEVVAMIDETHFLSGGDSGTLSLWSTGKKKPIFSWPVAHGLHQTHSETEGLLENPRWITALASLPYSDVFVSGSWDGSVRFWRLEKDLKSFKTLFQARVPGVINGLQLMQPSNDERGEVLCAVAAGQEHRLGRWLRVPEGRNEGVVLRLKRKSRVATLAASAAT